jgi:DNA (cytosine-5)-methyltransferase 1
MKSSITNAQNAVTSGRNKYLDILDDAWQEHLKPKAATAPTVISTFAGCGGSSLGYSMAGFRELLAVEWDQNAVDTFKINFPEVPVYHGDIAKLSVEEVLKMTGLEEGKLDVFDGSPPCQGFSTAGKRNMADSRNQLFREYVRLLRGLKPKVFVMENVSGMVKGKMKLIFAEILQELKASGYKVKAVLMNAMYFNVPQSRERMIFIGVRDDLGVEPSHPSVASVPATVGDAIYDIRLDVTDLPFNEDTRTARVMKHLPAGRSDPRHHSHVKLSYNKPSNTLLKDFLGYFHFWHPEQWRPLTMKEWARIGSYPDAYTWTDKKNGCQRIGNSVPPLFMKAIAEHIRVEILGKING